MIFTKAEILKLLVFAKQDDKFYFNEWEATPKQRTLAQNASFHRCFAEIAKKIWYAKESVKQNALKALFWVEKSKFGGIVYENALKPHTSELSIEEATLLLEALIELWKKAWCWELITSRQLHDLFNNN